MFFASKKSTRLECSPKEIGGCPIKYGWVWCQSTKLSVNQMVTRVVSAKRDGGGRKKRVRFVSPILSLFSSLHPFRRLISTPGSLNWWAFSKSSRLRERDKADYFFSCRTKTKTISLRTREPLGWRESYKVERATVRGGVRACRRDTLEIFRLLSHFPAITALCFASLKHRPSCRLLQKSQRKEESAIFRCLWHTSV